MEKLDQEYIIKKYVKPGVFMRLLPIIIILGSMVISSGFHRSDGSFDSGMFIVQSIMMSLVIFIIYKFHSRIIKVNEEMIIYQGLTRKIEVRYFEIEEFFIAITKIDKETDYSLILKTPKKYWKISDIDQYQKKDVELLIDQIKDKTQCKNDEKLLEESMHRIEWVEEKYNKTT